MNLTEISFSKVKTQIEDYLKKEYSKAGILFTPASPYGQILMVVENLYQLSMLYLKNTIRQFDLSDSNALNGRAIRNAAIFAGHIPGRSISASGTLKFTVKTSSDVESQIPGGRITIPNKLAIKNITNGLEYAFNLGTDSQTYKINTSTQFFIPILQGRWVKQTFTGSGLANQTFQINLRSNDTDVENFNYEIVVNGEYWTTKTHLYDLLPDEKACIVRTGFNGGIDIIFGNGGFGAIPQVSSIIEVNYLVTNGSSGSIFRRTPNDFSFIDLPLDGFGNSIDISTIFDISIHTDINFGADKETLQFTKNILPITSNNFVLGLPQQYAYQIKRLGVFSHVNAYADDKGIIYVVATPNIKLFKTTNSDYFTVDIKAFELDDDEKLKIDQYLKSGGNIQLAKRYVITSPTLSYYVMYVFIITYSDALDDSVNTQIYDRVSEYFLNFNRLDRVPKSDLVSQISDIKEIHSVDILFVSKKNEDYHGFAIQAAQLRSQNTNNTFTSTNPTPNQNPDYNEQLTPGLDSTLGDILFDPNEIPIIRGGWYDRNQNYYSSLIDDAGLKSINIIKKGSIDAKFRQTI
jgi:hypothetical protein